MSEDWNEGWKTIIQRADSERCLDQGQSCKCCFRQQRFDYEAYDGEWNMAVPKELRESALCIECYLRFCAVAS